MGAKHREWLVFAGGVMAVTILIFAGLLVEWPKSGITQDTTQNSTIQTANPLQLVSAAPLDGRTYNSSLGGFLSFNLTVRNIASAPVYYISGCGTSSLNLTVVPSLVVHLDQPPGPGLECGTFISSIPPGKLASISSSPTLRIIHSGNFVANLTLRWGWNDSYGLDRSTNFTVPFSVAKSSCDEPSSLPVLPVGSGPWFTTRIYYNELWNASITGYSGSTQVFHECAIGFGNGYMVFPDWNSSGQARLVITAREWVPSNNALFLAVNGNFTSVVMPYGSVTIVERLP